MFIFFSKTVEDFLLIFNKFLSTPLKKYKFKHTLLFFIWLFSVTDKINS